MMRREPTRAFSPPLDGMVSAPWESAVAAGDWEKRINTRGLGLFFSQAPIRLLTP